MLFDFLVIYLIIISVVAVVVTAYDKLSAIASKWRVSEKTLLLISVLGGSVAMYFTMLIIRHKTKKRKFMVGIPVIIILQIILYVLISVVL